ncbi:MAG TPA: trypsin-like peptidase domain-containing protein [Gaiellaceae bacterium]|nr:trypsin-like peptidase domain-containing protein [Gaiellaceae bacterium]
MVGRTRILAAAGVLAAAVLGAGLALGGVAAFGGLGRETTTVRAIQASAAPVSAPGSPAGALSINDIYRRAAPGVVQVTSTTVVTVPADPFFGNQFFPTQQREQSLGSGFVVDKAGHVVTNYHVISGARQVRVSFSNGASMKAAVVGADPSSDLAVLKIDASSRALTPLTLGDSDAMRVGDPVVAIGNPFGLDRTVTAGIVSAIQRAITAPNGYTIDHVIQTDAAINHGNSGGPLLDRRGDVIGVNSQIETGNDTSSGGNVGIGFAVPSNTVKTVIAQLIRQGRIDRAFLGIGAVPITADLARVFRLPVAHGLLVQSVQPGSGAAKAGLEAGSTQVVLAGESYDLGGDIVVRADGKPVASLSRLRDIVAAKKPGDTVHLVVYRQEKRKNVNVTLGRQPAARSG